MAQYANGIINVNEIPPIKEMFKQKLQLKHREQHGMINAVGFIA